MTLLLTIELHHGLFLGDVQRMLGDTAFCRLTPTTWLLESDKDEHYWAEKFKTLATSLFVSRIELKSWTGLLPQPAWNWIRCQTTP